MAGYVMNEEMNKLDLNTDIFSFDINSIANYIIDNYKQLLLFILMFVIIYIVDHITYYNALFNGITTSVPGLQPTQNQPNQLKSNKI